MFAQQRHDGFCQFLHVIVGFRTQQIAEYSADLVQQFAGLFISSDRVGECSRFRIIGDSINLRIVTVDTFTNSGFIMFGLYLFKRDSTVRRRILFKKRVLSLYYIHKAE